MSRFTQQLTASLSAMMNAAVFSALVAVGATAPEKASAGAHHVELSEIEVPGIFPRRDRAALLAITQSATATALDKAIAWHGLAGQREDGAAHTAVDLLSELPESATDPMIKAYLGSAYIMKARDQSFVPARVRSVRKGITILEEAVTAAPDSFEIRSLRAATTMNLPDIFDYRDKVQSDLALLIGMIESGKAPVPAGSPVHGRFVLALAKACAQDADMACARARLDEVRARFGGDADLTAPAAALTTALEQ